MAKSNNEWRFRKTYSSDDYLANRTKSILESRAEQRKKEEEEKRKKEAARKEAARKEAARKEAESRKKTSDAASEIGSRTKDVMGADIRRPLQGDAWDRYIDTISRKATGTAVGPYQSVAEKNTIDLVSKAVKAQPSGQQWQGNSSRNMLDEARKQPTAPYRPETTPKTAGAAQETLKKSAGDKARELEDARKLMGSAGILKGTAAGIPGKTGSGFDAAKVAQENRNTARKEQDAQPTFMETNLKNQITNPNSRLNRVKAYKEGELKPTGWQDYKENANREAEAKSLGLYNNSGDRALMTDWGLEQLKKKQEEALARKQAALPKTEEERQDLKLQYAAEDERAGKYRQLDANGLVTGFREPKLTNDPNELGTWREINTRKRPDDYDESTSYMYDQALYDYLNGTGAYQARVDSLETDEDVYALEMEMDDLWDRLEHRNMWELGEKAKDAKRQGEIADILLNGDRNEKSELEKTQRELAWREEKDRLLAGAKGGYQPKGEVAGILTRTEANGGKPANLQDALLYKIDPYTGAVSYDAGDAIDQSLFEAQHPGLMAGKTPYADNMPVEWFMSDDQVKELETIYGSGSPEEKENAKAYLDGITPLLNTRKAQYQTGQDYENASGELGALYGLATIPDNMIAGAKGVVNIIKAAFGDKEAQDPNSAAWADTRRIQTTRGARANVWDDAVTGVMGEGWKGVGSFVNSTIYSIADDLTRLAAAGAIGSSANAAWGIQEAFDKTGRTAGGILQFIASSEAAADEMQKQLGNNKSVAEAAILATGNGIIEAITENMGWDALMKPNVREMLGDGRQLAKFVAKTAAAEGMEEISSDVFNTMMDLVVSSVFGHEDEITKEINELWAEGVPLKVASNQVIGNRLDQTLLSGLAGAVSGGVSAAGRVGVNAVSQAKIGKQINSKQNIQEGKTGAERILDIGLSMDKGTQSRELAEGLQQKGEQRLKTGQGVMLNHELGQLAQNIMEESGEQMKKTIQDTVAREAAAQIRAEGVEATEANREAEVIAKAATQGIETLSREEMSVISADSTAVRVLKSFVTNRETNRQLNQKAAEATKEQRAIRQTVEELATGKTRQTASAVSRDVTASAQNAETATEEEMRIATGKRTGTATEALYDGQVVEILRKDGDNLTVSVNGKEETAPIASVKAANRTAATVLNYAGKNDNLISDRYTNKVLEGISRNRETDAGRYLDDAMKIRLAAMSLGSMPTTGIDSETARTLYNDAREEFVQRDKERTRNAQPAAKPGQGTATFNGTEYGTGEFTEQLQGLSRSTRNQVGALAEIAVRAGMRVNFINDTENPNIYGWEEESSGKITINLAGENADGMKHHLLVTAGHEMTHWLEQNSSEGYAELRQFILDTMREDGVNIESQLMKIVDEYGAVMSENGQKRIDLNGAMAEFIANSCDQVLGDESVIQRLSRENPSLFDKIKTYVKNFAARIRAAVAGMGASASRESLQLMRYTEEIADLWLKAYDEALGKKEAGNAKENTGRQYSFKRSDGSDIVMSEDEIEKNVEEIINSEPIGNIKGNAFAKGDIPLRKRLTKYFEDIGGRAYNEVIGEVMLEKGGAEHFARFVNGKAAAAIPLIKNVIEKGKIVDLDDNHKEKRFPTVAIVGKISLDGEPYLMGVGVRQLFGNDNRYWMHNVVMINEKNGDQLNLMGRVAEQGSGRSTATDDPHSLYSILLKIRDRNVQSGKNEKKSMSARQKADPEQERLVEEVKKAQEERNRLRDQYREIIHSDEYNARIEELTNAKREERKKAAEELARWEQESGLAELKKRSEEADKLFNEKNKQLDDYLEKKEVEKEKKAIEESGLSEADWRRKQAVKEYGYTTNFREAGYLLPDGKMLNFTGEKGKHYGSRGLDHRNIGAIYASSEKQNSAAMLDFMAGGNIRVMAETPGIDINASTEPTKEQYNTIRNMAQRFASEEYFNIDFTDERGNTVDSIEYDGRISGTKIINDIKTFYRTGEAPQQSTVSQFHYSARRKNVDVSDWKTYTTRNGEMYMEDQNGNETKLEGLDREYVEAWNRGDFDRMEEILMDKIRENGAVPFKAPKAYDSADHMWVAKAIKEGDTYAIQKAAAEMAELVPENAVLVPMPNHHGIVDENTDTMILAEEISKITDRPVIVALEGVERESRRDNKKKPKSQQMTAEDLGFRQVAEIPEGTIPYIVDNVVASGLTAQAAHQALGNNGVTLAYAKSIRSANDGLKRANVTFYDTNGRYGQYLIPLSERIDMDKTGYTGTKFSVRQLDEAYMRAVESGDEETARKLMEETAANAGYTIHAYHGTGRADRVGNVFLPERSTSGPMAFFTDNRRIAEGYARNKSDTSLAYEEEYGDGDYENQFRYKTKDGKTIPITKLWDTLNMRSRLKIKEAGKHITYDEDGEEIIYDKNTTNGNGGFTETEIRRNGGNAISALIDVWLNSGDLMGDEEKFLDVLRLAGIDGVTWNNPDYREEKVYDTFLKISNPFVTNEMYNQEFLDGLKSWWEDQDQSLYERETKNADEWDKNSLTMEKWIKKAELDFQLGSSYAFTSIPDFVTDYLKSEGYDGIRDVGGKGGGTGHTVWIPFSSEQVKSAETVTRDDAGNVIPLSERFNPKNRDIRYSIGNRTLDITRHENSGGDQSVEGELIRYAMAQSNMEVNTWMLGLNENSLSTVQERNLLKQYKDLRMAREVATMAYKERQKKLLQLKAKENPTAYDREQIRKLTAMMQNSWNKLERLENDIVKVTSSEGYAGMMYAQSRIMNDLVEGRTAEEVRETTNVISRELENITREMSERAERLKELADAEGVASARAWFANSGLSRLAKKIKTDMNSKMPTKDIENRLALITLKMRDGQQTAEDITDLAGLIIDRAKSDYESYVLSELRGTTFTISKSQLKELKGQGSSLKEIQKEIAGSGVRIKSGDSNTLDMVWDELCDRIPRLNRDASDKDMLGELVDLIKGEMKLTRGSATQGQVSEVGAEIMEAVIELMGETGKVDKSTREMLDYIKTLSTEARDTAQAMGDLQAAVERMKIKGNAAKDATAAMGRKVEKAIEYFNTLTEQSEAAIWRRERVKLIEQMKSDAAEQVLKEREKWREKIEKSRTVRDMMAENAHVRSQINTNVKRVRKLLINETDQKNIPENMKGLAREMLKLVIRNDLNGKRKLSLIEQKDLSETWRILVAQEKQSGQFELDELRSLGDEEIKYVVEDALADIEDGIMFYNAGSSGEITANLKGLKDALDKIQKGVTTISQIITAEREISFMDRRIAVADAAWDVTEGMKSSRFKGEWRGKLGRGIDAAHGAIVSGNTTPVYFIKNLRNQGMTELWQEFERGENRNGLEMEKARAYIEGLAESVGYKNWDTGKKYTVSLSGEKVQMTLEQMMAMYATWKREKTFTPERSSHMEEGGVYIREDDTNEGIIGREKINAKAHRVSEEDMKAIENTLTKEQKEYVDKMVSYLSKEMSELGNEASMRMYGIRKYLESYYFPMKIWEGVKSARSDQGISGTSENRAAHRSWSKRRMDRARNALVIENFTDTAVKHIVEMINYNTMAPAVENVNKVLNYQQDMGDRETGTKRNVRAAFADAYGKEALRYLEQFMKDLNGGAVQDNRKTLMERALSMFKKNAVAGSMSVALQQPLSYIRAAMMISPKYLAQAISPAYWKGSRKEMLENSGVAVIKEMGRFDMNFGQSGREYITPEGQTTRRQRVMDFISEKSTVLPELMDMMTWTRMWSAVKLEQHAAHPEMDMKSDAFLDLVAERFNDVMRKTQVYDSVLTKSSNMRSSNYAMKVLTSFMAEPTLTLNVLGDAVANVKEKGGKATLAKAGATFILSAVLQAAVKAGMGAGRSPDEKKTFLENFLNKFGYNLINEANPVSLIPGYSDLIEALKQGELKDDAMSIFGKFKSVITTAQNAINGNGKGVYRDIEDSVGQLAQLFTNVPVKNIMRDARAMYNWVRPGTYANRESSGAVIKYQALDTLHTADNLMGLLNEWLKEAGYETKNAAYYQRIYEAKKAGNTAAAEEMTEYLKLAKLKGEDPDKTINSAVTGLAKKDDSMTPQEKVDFLMKEGASNIPSWIVEQYQEGKITEAEAKKLYKQADPKKTDDEIFFAFDRADYKAETGDMDASGKYYRLYAAIDSGNAADLTAAKKQLKEHGTKDEEISSQIQSYILKPYKEGKKNKAQTEALLKKYRPELDENDRYWIFDRIDYKNKTGEDASGYYYRLKDAISANRAEDIQKAVKQLVDHGVEKKNIKSKLSDWKQEYLDADSKGRIRIRDAITKAYKALGYTAADADKTINNWTKQKKTSAK